MTYPRVSNLMEVFRLEYQSCKGKPHELKCSCSDKEHVIWVESSWSKQAVSQGESLGRGSTHEVRSRRWGRPGIWKHQNSRKECLLPSLLNTRRLEFVKAWLALVKCNRGLQLLHACLWTVSLSKHIFSNPGQKEKYLSYWGSWARLWDGLWAFQTPRYFRLKKFSSGVRVQEKFILISLLACTISVSTLLFVVLTYLTLCLHRKLAEEKGGNRKTDF